MDENTYSIDIHIYSFHQTFFFPEAENKRFNSFCNCTFILLLSCVVEFHRRLVNLINYLKWAFGIRKALFDAYT